MRVIHHCHHAQDVGFVDDDTRKAEYAPCRIIGMDRHIDVVFVADRHDALQELRLPARHDRAVGVTCDGFKHVLRIKGVNSFLCVRENCGAVRSYTCQFCSGSVKDRHEVVVNVHVSLRRASLDGVMDVDALGTGNVKS